MIPAPFTQAVESLTKAMPEAAEWLSQVSRVAAGSAPAQQRVRAVLLHDAYGQMHVVTSELSAIDLERLNIEMQRELRAAPQEARQGIQDRFNWPVYPVVPFTPQAEVAVDQRVLDLTETYLPANEPDTFLKVPGQLMRALMAEVKSRSGTFSVGLPQIKVNHLEPEEDLDQIKQAIQSFTSLRIQKRLEDTLEMPPLPETARRIINLRVDPNAGISDLADIVETDPSLAAQVVSWASSSFYAAPGKIRSVQDAIVRVLGFDLVMNLSMGLALGKVLDMPKDEIEGHTPYWEQAVWTATFTGALATLIPRESRPETGLLYLAGLLHNYGYLVLAHVFPPHFSLVCRSAEVNHHVDPEFCEQHLLGITREQIGSSLMRVWNMPEEVVTALRHQKNPQYLGEHAAYGHILYIATQLLRSKGIGDSAERPIPPELWEAAGLTEEEARQALDELLLMSDEMKMLANNLDPAAA